MGLYKYQDIGGTWGPKAEGTLTQGRSPARPPAVRALLGAARLEQSAHNEALSDVAKRCLLQSRGGRLLGAQKALVKKIES